MDTPLWLFQRDEIDVLESELDAIWDRHMKGGSRSGTDEETVLKEYADTEDWAETELVLRAGPADEPSCHHEEERQAAFEELPLLDYLRQGLQRDPLYVDAYAWARRVAERLQARPPEAKDAPADAARHAFRARINALLVPVKISFAVSGEVHEGARARATARTDYELAGVYLKRAAQSLERLGEAALAEECLPLYETLLRRRGNLEAGGLRGYNPTEPPV